MPKGRSKVWVITEPSVALLLAIGVADMVSTAALHAQGKIVELNPMMAPVIDRSEWLFVLLKSATLVAGGIALNRLAKTHKRFVPAACIGASAMYVTVWATVFLSSH